MSAFSPGADDAFPLIPVPLQTTRDYRPKTPAFAVGHANPRNHQGSVPQLWSSALLPLSGRDKCLLHSTFKLGYMSTSIVVKTLDAE